MKTKLLILAALLGCFALSGCNPPSSIDALKAVQTEYPNADIKNLPGRSFAFIVRTQTGEIWLVETMNLNSNDISNQVRLFNAPKP